MREYWSLFLCINTRCTLCHFKGWKSWCFEQTDVVPWEERPLVANKTNHVNRLIAMHDLISITPSRMSASYLFWKGPGAADCPRLRTPSG